MVGICVFGSWIGQMVAFAQTAQADIPIDVETGFLQVQGAQPRFESASKIAGQGMVALHQQQILSVPHFTGSFFSEGKVFPYTLVGGSPQAGGTTEIPTQLIPIAMFFEGLEDESGEPIVLTTGHILPRVMSSPNFRTASYATGNGQFADAVQRAQFFRIMAQDWHTTLGEPQELKPVVIDVPRGLAKVYRNRSTGVLYAVVDSAFFISQLNTIVQIEELRHDALVLALTANVFLSPGADVKRCCVLGFHTAFENGRPANIPQIQTLVWASWIDQGILGTSVADVTPLSHEISEWMNNPFGNNVVPAWQPFGGSGGCQTTIETADPLAALPNAGYPVPIDGYVYHPQSQVLLNWFGAPSYSFDGAFSFPDEGLVTRPAQPCSRR
jgi:chitinase